MAGKLVHQRGEPAGVRGGDGAPGGLAPLEHELDGQPEVPPPPPTVSGCARGSAGGVCAGARVPRTRTLWQAVVAVKLVHQRGKPAGVRGGAWWRAGGW